MCQGSVGPGEEGVVKVWALFSKEGVFDVNKWRILVKAGEGGFSQNSGGVRNVLVEGK